MFDLSEMNPAVDIDQIEDEFLVIDNLFGSVHPGYFSSRFLHKKKLMKDQQLKKLRVIKVHNKYHQVFCS
jgi:hypothetical protein